jgi:hypothetical protein
MAAVGADRWRGCCKGAFCWNFRLSNYPYASIHFCGSGTEIWFRMGRPWPWATSVTHCQSLSRLFVLSRLPIESFQSEGNARSHVLAPYWSLRTEPYQEVSRRLLIAAARLRVQVTLCGICGGQSGTEALFLRVLRFPLPILIPLTAPHSSSSIIRGWYNRTNSDRRTKWTQSHPARRRN